MTGAHDAGGGFGRSAGANAARGIAVIAIAVVVGLLLMSQGLDDQDVEATASTTTTTTADGATDTTATTAADGATETSDTTAPVDTTLGAPRPPAEVKVLVLNGTDGIKGVAGRGTEVVAAAGYATADPKNADIVGPSIILFVEGYESDARAVAGVFGVDPDATVRPFDPASTPIADTQSSHVIVRVGNDGLIQV